MRESRLRAARLRLPHDHRTLAYLAGLFDGEGCITRTNDHPIVQIGMTDEPVMRWVAEIGGTLRVEDHPNRGNRKPLYRWRLLAGSDVREFLWALFPYLRVKRTQAEEAICEIWGLDLLWQEERDRQGTLL